MTNASINKRPFCNRHLFDRFSYIVVTPQQAFMVSGVHDRLGLPTLLWSTVLAAGVRPYYSWR